MSETDIDPGFYARMLPPKEGGGEALGGFLCAIGAGIGIIAIFFMPLLLGGIAMLCAGVGVVCVRSLHGVRMAGLCFAIATCGWFLGMARAVVLDKPLGLW